jgi:hypothetical protein
VVANNYLYAVNPDGTEKWHYQADFDLGQPVLGLKGTLYFTTSDGYLNAIVSSPSHGDISGAIDLLLNHLRHKTLPGLTGERALPAPKERPSMVSGNRGPQAETDEPPSAG